MLWFLILLLRIAGGGGSCYKCKDTTGAGKGELGLEVPRGGICWSSYFLRLACPQLTPWIQDVILKTHSLLLLLLNASLYQSPFPIFMIWLNLSSQSAFPDSSSLHWLDLWERELKNNRYHCSCTKQAFIGLVFIMTSSLSTCVIFIHLAHMEKRASQVV